MREAEPGNAETMARLDELRGSDEALAVVAELIPTLSEDSRWAGIYVYALSGNAPEILRPLVADADPGIVAHASAGLARRGDVAGLGGLIATLGREGFLPGSRPPIPLWVFATDQLVSLTAKFDLGPPFDADRPEVLSAAERWGAWLSANEDSVVFEGGMWRT